VFKTIRKTFSQKNIAVLFPTPPTPQEFESKLMARAIVQDNEDTVCILRVLLKGT
jgi:hypothetical protein